MRLNALMRLNIIIRRHRGCEHEQEDCYELRPARCCDECGNPWPCFTRRVAQPEGEK